MDYYYRNGSPLTPKADDTPLLIVVVDTEEEFDWAAMPKRKNTSVSHMEHLYLTHEICVDYGLSPCYVVDYPITSQPLSSDVLKSLVEKQQCEIGAHMHPWVNPPFAEELSIANMYPGNLQPQHELAKLTCLRDQIEQTFGFKPISYKAGRYGFGPNTLSILKKLGFKVDLSFCPPMNHSYDGGPDYSKCHSSPFIFQHSNILEIPLSGGFTGRMGNASNHVFNFAEKLKKLRLPGILARSNMLDRLVLSPEGYTTGEHIKLTRHLYNRGQRIFTWSFHSPTAVPGLTQYVSNEKEKQQYLDSFKSFFDFFFNELQGRASTPTEIYRMTEK